ncbi:ABC transporter ATP-binding protein [Paenibacillus radicis (ex Gao et al. 2016)]|uniref:ABC transporter ATP-binding protein n=1 Tax=Paenibacillus radicis (ex Gao et al. 2016) TaxID=1737354 RepID=A0A917LXE5_9BACL|nr:ABC transporter ATP-binding protein [Paenibacillus radicis (ex Gao et al. 2016)]GGG64038.1 putative ABC transporter ATP-binding protein [Paenibacillus radicis (ex Gao et al. 2016)]
MSERKPVIQFEDFSFQYRAQSEPTLREINLTIYEGEKVLIVGPSGSGKSTLGHCINGLVPAFYSGELSGSAAIQGKPLKELGIFELSELVGTVLQDPDGQFVGLTVAEDIAFKLENEAMEQAEIHRRVAAAALAVGMDKHLGDAPQNLSGGQKQRTSLGGVLVSDANILLFDEPLANLDPHTGKLAIELIDRVHREMNKTVIIIEHRLEDVLHRDVDRIIVMQEGRIIADQSASELLRSELLGQTGIREPLYITALKYAGCQLRGEMRLERVDELRVEHCSAELQAWQDAQPEEDRLKEGTPLLEIEDLSFGYEPDSLILEHVSLRINKGEMVSIVGKNGAGKSTLSKLICGFYRPSSGVLKYQGADMRSDTIKERAERIGFVMQNPNHMLSKTQIFDEVALGLQVRGVTGEELERRVYEALKICGLYPFRNWPVSALSFGQKKRVTIASILVLEPEVIILDEPTAGQDFKHYNEMMEFLRTLNREGMTVVMITHDMHLMLEYADRTIVLADGKKLADDTPAHILTDASIVEAADLKETSVFELAQRAGLANPREFVSRFISYDRRVRGR